MASSLEALKYFITPELKTELDKYVNPVSYDDKSATAGAATSNTATGKCAVALGASSVTITNSLCTAKSVVCAVAESADATGLRVRRVVPAAGSFVIHVEANATADMVIRWAIHGVR